MVVSILDLLALTAGNGWEWGHGIIIHNYCGSFPHSRSEAPVSKMGGGFLK